MNNNDDSFVTILTCSQAADAEVARTKLESEEIECFIADYNIATINPLYGAAIGGVKVQVRGRDIEKARTALGIVENPQPSKETCPKCHSLDVSFGKLPGILSLLAAFFLSMFLPLKNVQWKCRACGHTWRKS